MNSRSCFRLIAAMAMIACPAASQEPPKPVEAQCPQTTQTKQPPEENAPVPSAALPTETLLVLGEGTPVKLKLLHTVNSKTAVTDDPLNFSVVEDVVVDGRVLVRAGAAAIGQVKQAKPARSLGRGAALGLEMQYLKAGRIRVPLRGSQERAGQGKKGDTVALVVLFGISGLVKHGSEIVVKEGSIFTAYVDADTTIPAPQGPS